MSNGLQTIQTREMPLPVVLSHHGKDIHLHLKLKTTEEHRNWLCYTQHLLILFSLDVDLKINFNIDVCYTNKFVKGGGGVQKKCFYTYQDINTAPLYGKSMTIQQPLVKISFQITTVNTYLNTLNEVVQHFICSLVTYQPSKIY